MPYSRLFYHFVWATKERLPLITTYYRDPIYAAIATKVKDFRGIAHAINGTADHIHLVVTLPPRISPAIFIGQVKGGSSHLASSLANGETDFAWQHEYGVVSVSESQLPMVVRYVRLQQQHHETKMLDQRLESCG